MPIGVLTGVAAVAVGGILGALLREKVTENLKVTLNMIFGLCAMGMGIQSIVLMVNLPAVIFTLIVGTMLGLAVRLGDRIRAAGAMMQRFVSRFVKAPNTLPEEEFMSTLITIIVLFCASSSGIYGCIVSGISGDHSILIAKAILDLFTAMIFACSLGVVVSVIALPQLVLFLALFALAKVIYPLTTPTMIGDFKACGGFLLVATGFRMLKLREFPIADMIPAMFLVMPMSALWTNVVLPLLV